MRYRDRENKRVLAGNEWLFGLKRQVAKDYMLRISTYGGA